MSKLILPIIIISQFFCTSMWFAGNGVMLELLVYFKLEASAIGHLTSAVQLGFIFGTLVFALFAFADRFSPSKVFLICAIMGAITNSGIALETNQMASLLSFRFLTGFFLAGIYPVGMKIAADHYDQSLSKVLAYLVGALVLGTAFPHLAKALTSSSPWKLVIYLSSGLTLIGGILINSFVPDGPYRKKGSKLRLRALKEIFKNHELRDSALGYFGHMWELYAFWAFVPWILTRYQLSHQSAELNVSLASFFIIGLGGLACVLGAYISKRLGTKITARWALILSGACCLLSPLALNLNNLSVLISFLLFWGAVVIADSPLFSTLIAQNAPAEVRGTAITLVTCIGFSISIGSIQLLNVLQTAIKPYYLFTPLVLGPILGVLALSKKENQGPKKPWIGYS